MKLVEISRIAGDNKAYQGLSSIVDQLNAWSNTHYTQNLGD